MDSRGGYISKILYVKMKESGSLGGRAMGTPPLDPPMVQVWVQTVTFLFTLIKILICDKHSELKKNIRCTKRQKNYF